MSKTNMSIDTTNTSNAPTIMPTALANWCNDYLQVNRFKDYSPNGLQVDANTPIQRLVTGVSATQNLIERARELEADAILVHHGYFWKGEPEALVGMKGKRIRTLLQNNLSLLAYHLPLDAHPVIGNNAVLAEQLGLTIIGGLYPDETHPIGNIATCPSQSITAFIDKITDVLNRPPLHIAAGNTTIKQVGLCTGGAQDMIEQAAKMGCELYISGEISERTTHLARELGIDYLAAGHHATEMGGIQALGQLIESIHGIAVTFVDDPNPA